MDVTGPKADPAWPVPKAVICISPTVKTDLSCAASPKSMLVQHSLIASASSRIFFIPKVSLTTLLKQIKRA